MIKKLMCSGVLLSAFCLFASLSLAYGQSRILSGMVIDEQELPVPFASIYKKNSNVGTAANSDGKFHLALSGGSEYELVVRAVGYRELVIKLDAQTPLPLKVVLKAEAYSIEEVLIGGEDPAYAIIRKAISKRKQHLDEGESYQARVYLKGVQRLLQAPKKFLGIDMDMVGNEIGLDSNRSGILYLSESESIITVSPPRDFKEEMISSRVSGNNRAFSFNRASDLELNFYQNHQPIFEGLSGRPFVSPIADNALSYYRYQYLGSSDENGELINKIRVTSRRKGEPLYEGDIYIMEDTWRIYGVNLMLTKSSGINLIDSLMITQDFIPVQQGQWVASNVRFDFVGGIFAFRFGGYFAAVYSDYAFNPQVTKGFFNEVLRINKAVNEKDTAYWEQNRKIKLTQAEREDYLLKDSLQQRREREGHLDSLDRITNRFRPIGFLMSGYSYRNRAKRTTLNLAGPLTSLSFNSVEGAVINYQMRYSKVFDPIFNRRYNLNGNLRYGFANKRLNGALGAVLPIGLGQLELAGGSEVRDVNLREELSFNSVYTLFFGRNHQKFFENKFGRFAWSQSVLGNVKLRVSTEWSDRMWLPNATDYTVFLENRDYLTSNNPFHPNEDIPLFESHQSLVGQVRLSYDFGRRYETLPNQRRYLPSIYPTLAVQYTKGIPSILGSDVDYDLLSADITKTDMLLGLYGKVSFFVSAGKFLNNRGLFYLDSKHFLGTHMPVNYQHLHHFLLLDNYRYSTQGAYIEAHGTYNLATMLTGKVPFLRRLKLQEIVGVHYLKTSELPNYAELHAGLQWNTFRVSYARAFFREDATFHEHAVRIGIGVRLR